MVQSDWVFATARVMVKCAFANRNQLEITEYPHGSSGVTKKFMPASKYMSSKQKPFCSIEKLYNDEVNRASVL